MKQLQRFLTSPLHLLTRAMAAGLFFPLALSSLAGYPFADTFESGLGQWTTNGGWGLTTSRSASAPWSVTDSPGSFYPDNLDATLTLRTAVNLATAVRPALSFRHAYYLEEGYDFGRVEVSADGGATWSPPLLSLTGQRPAMTEEQVDLSPWAGQADVRLRFRLITDSSVVMDGWYIDDVVIGEAPAPVALHIGAETTPNSVSLAWSRSPESAFACYLVYRSLQPTVNWRTSQLVARIEDVDRTNLVDIAVSPKTLYYYQVLVMNTSGLRSTGVVQSVTTPPGMNYPFVDNAEGGPGAWNPTTPWAISSEEAHSGAHAWSDSPGEPYANGIASQPLTLVAPLDLRRAVAPVLTFTHKHALASGDSGYVEVSINHGTDWTALTNVTGSSGGKWRRIRLSLASLAGQPSVLVRFRLTTDAGNAGDGWWLDDISVAESPTVVPAPVLDQITSHSLRLTWPANTNLQFSHYAIYRSTSPGVSMESDLVAAVSNQLTTTWTDAGLALDTVYYYRVYAVSPYGAFSDHSPTESAARTLNNPPPFGDDFEGGLMNWNLGGAWGLTTNRAASGLYCLADSPLGNYQNGQDTWAATAVNLQGTAWPILEFKERFHLADGDWTRVEVSPDGANWTIVYGGMGIRPDWTTQTIDLSPWRNQANLRLRFRLGTGSQPPTDGWCIDDVRVVEHVPVPVSFPLFESFEAGTGNWFGCGWTRVTNQPLEGVWCIQDSLTPRLSPNAQVVLQLAGPLDLTAAVNPQIAAWVRGYVNPYAWFRIQVLPQGAYDWRDLPEANLDHPFDAGWTRRQASLRAYTNQVVRLRFLVACDWRAPDEDLLLDKIAITEMPQPVWLATPTPHLRTVDLSWMPSPLGGAFKRYEVYRATHSEVTTSDTFLAAFHNLAETNFTDSGLSIGATYYYRVFTVDTNDLFTPSNERSTTTVPLALPVADSLDSADQWVTTGQWGITTNPRHSGTGALSDSPGDNYGNNQDTYAMTALNLAGSSWPVLRFRDSHRLAEGDWGRVEVSPDGNNWTILYGVMGVRSEWREQAIDLSRWKNQSNLRLRFRLGTDGSAVEDGWHIDDLSVVEAALSPLSFPFFESFESGLDNWLASGWSRTTNQALTGAASAWDTDTPRMAPNTELVLHLAGPMDLANTVNPQIVLWARGTLNPYAWFRIQVSADHGLNWQDLSSADLDHPFNAGWTRRQASLQAFTNRVIRLRLVTACDWRAPDEDLVLDKLAITEMPAPVFVHTPAPALRSVELSWTQSSLGPAFQRYELYRATHPGVTLSDTRLAALTNLDQTTFTDTGLTIGATYYYKVYTVDTNDLYSDSNEPFTTTVPLALPMADDLENLDRWIVSGGWGIATNASFVGQGSLNDSPLGEYANNSDTWAMTAVNLTGSTWPVLRFWDRHRMASGDWGRVEVSTDGNNWTPLYGVMDVRTNWALQAIDLSPWRSSSNLRIRFREAADGANVDDGWFIDGISITDHAATVMPYPFYERFETGLDRWLVSGWTLATNEPFEGQWVLHDTAEGRMAPDSERTLVLAGPLVLTNANQPEITFWVRGQTGPYNWLRVQVSTDAGRNWSDLPGVNVDHPFNAGWMRKRASLSAYTNQTIRLRFYAGCDWRAPEEDLFLDKITIEDAPPAVILAPITDATVSTLRLTWTASAAANFKEYRIYRAESSSVDENSTLIAVLTDRDTTSFVDTGLVSRKLYYYRIYVYNENDTGSGSNQGSAMTLGVPMGWTEDFESSQTAWTMTGTWTRLTGAGREGGTALVDSPADYANSSDTYAQFAINLVGTTWPVLRFWDRHTLADHDYGRLELSPDAGSSWQRIYGVAGTRTNWNEQTIDLSPWKNSSQVWLRFRLLTDGGTQADGWYVDDVAAGENDAPDLSYPFFDGFEQGLARWQHASWAVDANEPRDGNWAVRDTPAGRMPPDTQLSLTLARELPLTNAVNPQLSFWVRGYLNPYAWLRVQVSTDGGLNWSDLSTLNLDHPFNSGWTRKQVSLQTYTNRTLRLRFLLACDWRAPDVDLFLDDIGIGEPAPGATTLNAPAMLASVNVVRPTLVVNNAFEFQTDPLTYRFEVYADSGLSNVVAQVPAVASGAHTTAWQVDVDLPNNRQYWWRCQASDGANLGPWMDTATFFVNELNHAPLPPALAGPPNGLLVTNLDTLLMWFPTSDPDEGDRVAGYEVQVADNPGFVTPLITDTNVPAHPSPEGGYWTIAVPLGSLEGAASLASGTTCYWRVRARDLRGLPSDWSAGPALFQFGPPAPRGGTIQALRLAGPGLMVMEWSGAAGSVYVDFTWSLTPPVWTTVAGPLQGTNWVFRPMPGAASGFYRLRAE